MTKPNPYRPFRADPAQLALKPQVSGNDINSRGEATPHAPRVVYWASDPDLIPHGKMQRLFYAVDPHNPDLARARAGRAPILAQPLAPLLGEPVPRSPQAWTQALTAFATGAGSNPVVWRRWTQHGSTKGSRSRSRAS